MQSVCTKPRIYVTYGSYLGAIYELNWFFLINKVYMIHQKERCMFSNNNKTIKTLPFTLSHFRHVGLFMLILLLSSSFVCLSRFGIWHYFFTTTCFFNLVIFDLLCSFVLSFKLVSNYLQIPTLKKKIV